VSFVRAVAIGVAAILVAEWVRAALKKNNP
jgi:hypothetical protein